MNVKLCEYAPRVKNLEKTLGKEAVADFENIVKRSEYYWSIDSLVKLSFHDD
jgi:hypothetical protein